MQTKCSSLTKGLLHAPINVSVDFMEFDKIQGTLTNIFTNLVNSLNEINLCELLIKMIAIVRHSAMETSFCVSALVLINVFNSFVLYQMLFRNHFYQRSAKV